MLRSCQLLSNDIQEETVKNPVRDEENKIFENCLNVLFYY